jgi:RNA polymerase sigma factor (TIGR02999 family)
MSSPDASPPRNADPDTALDVPLRDVDQWFTVLYHELRRMARGELFRHQALTLGPHTLVHEAWMRLDAADVAFRSQGELIAYAARTMRGLVIDQIRARHSQKRGGQWQRVTLETLSELMELGDAEALRINEALEVLSKASPALAELVELKFFAGMNVGEIAQLRAVSERTVQRDWEKARIMLFSTLNS